MNRIHRLQTLSNILKHHPSNVMPILKQYYGKDWIHYVYRDSQTGYHRVLLDRDTNYSLFLMTWYPRAYTEIHSHPSHCYFSVLYGSLIEHRFSPTKQYLDKYILSPSDIGYIHDSIGCHRIVNNNQNDLAVSLHVYLSSSDQGHSHLNTHDMQSFFHQN